MQKTAWLRLGGRPIRRDHILNSYNKLMLKAINVLDKNISLAIKPIST